MNLNEEKETKKDQKTEKARLELVIDLKESERITGLKIV
jgi:hypothetical protein